MLREIDYHDGAGMWVMNHHGEISKSALAMAMKLHRNNYHKEEPQEDLQEEAQAEAETNAEEEFRMYEYKVRLCTRVRSHDWTECLCAHPGEKARRRDPRLYSYLAVPCPDFRKGRGGCRKGDACGLAHGVFECWLHPDRYRTQPCKDTTPPSSSCTRRVCFFAHNAHQLRPRIHPSNGTLSPPPSSPSNSTISSSSSPNSTLISSFLSPSNSTSSSSSPPYNSTLSSFPSPSSFPLPKHNSSPPPTPLSALVDMATPNFTFFQPSSHHAHLWPQYEIKTNHDPAIDDQIYNNAIDSRFAYPRTNNICQDRLVQIKENALSDAETEMMPDLSWVNDLVK